VCSWPSVDKSPRDRSHRSGVRGRHLVRGDAVSNGARPIRCSAGLLFPSERTGGMVPRSPEAR
jgi:hypothetical protein